MSTRYFMGLDIGSTTSKCLLVDENGQIVSYSVADAGTGTGGPNRAVSATLADAGIEPSAVTAVVATGYGRKSAPLATKTMSELSCHARGARFLFPGARTVIDIGGQDAKVLRINDRGDLSDFVMNDKCAAGTGRFLEVMSRILELDLDKLSEAGMRSKNPAEISSTCTVFAESEVISQLASQIPIDDIAAGIHRSVASRVLALAKRLGVIPEVVMTGGVAKNNHVRKCLEQELGVPITTSKLAQLAGALGAALYAGEL